MSYNYSQYVTELAVITAIDPSDASFQSNLPSVIDYAEQRCYRELQLLSTVTRDTATLTADSRTFVLPSNNGRFVTTQGINVYGPNGTGTVRVQLTPASRDYVDAAWPSETSTSTTSVPSYYAMLTDQTVIVAPAPGSSWVAEVVGTIRPTPLSVSNTTTYLTTYLPDLFIAASMVQMSGYMRNFGSQADDPKMAQSWENQYQMLLKSADIEENMKRYASGAWSSQPPTPLASPTR
jgi:hypothetical protein